MPPVNTLICGHVAYTATTRTCMHLAVDDPPDYFRLLRGVGMDYDLVCQPCGDGDDPASTLIRVCEGCAERAADFGEVLGWHGRPQVVIRDAEPGGSWTANVCDVRLLNDRCLAPLPDGWLALTPAGLASITDTGVVVQLGPVKVQHDPEQKTWVGRVPGPALHTSADGRFAAVVTDYGRYGTVLELATGAAVFTLDRGAYRHETTPFPFTFVGAGATTKLIAATAWNRLDVFDAATGRVLTERDTHWEKGGRRPEHYLDYFHGRLSLNPSQSRLLDDGWVWAPVGIPKVIDVDTWLRGQPYTSEHGETLAWRHYAWDQPVAWLDDDTVAIQRIGSDDEAMIDGVEVYDVRNGRCTGMFAGPVGRMWARDDRLFVVAASGLEVWDPAAGARIGQLDGFRPTAASHTSGAFAELTDRQLRIWRP
jgi:hypothetical protein